MLPSPILLFIFFVALIDMQIFLAYLCVYSLAFHFTYVSTCLLRFYYC